MSEITRVILSASIAAFAAVTFDLSGRLAGVLPPGDSATTDAAINAAVGGVIAGGVYWMLGKV